MSAPQITLIGARILIVDDNPENLRILRQTLEAEGYKIFIATGGEPALKTALGVRPDLILLDVMMPGIDGFETCRRLKADDVTRDIPVVFITARAETEALVEGFRAGGVDYIIKPFQDEEVLVRVQNHLRTDRLARELIQRNRELQAEIARRQLTATREAEFWGIDGFIGESQTIKDTLDAISRLQNVETSVLITGENGTGKELIARAIHHGSPRADGPFIPVNCSAIPSELAESMLFGHARGAFTGADSDRSGYFELADGGTLFLDEVGDMPLDIQPMLLRILEDGVVLPVGAPTEKQVDVRVLAATNADLQSAVNEGAFRQDLYFRLARFPVRVPPLRERRSDIPLLARHFLFLLSTEMSLDPTSLSPEALSKLEAYHFPGNVRELRNILERALIESAGHPITPQHLHFFDPTPAAQPQPPPDSPLSITLPLDLKAAEDLLIQHALDQTHGNISEAARLLNTNRHRIYKFLQELESRSQNPGDPFPSAKPDPT